ncbi:MAG: FAD binding domain-containing protein [Oscillospiraceae bacterium]|nr:FAD binding domain-containing protein [Oscillospiraceae bacterium]
MVRPENLNDALKTLSRGGMTICAGGTDVMVYPPENARLLMVDRLPELKLIEDLGDAVRIGAAVTFTEGIESPIVPELMKAALRRIAAPAIRNMGTFGGNIGNGSAKADSVLIDFVLDAKLELASIRGTRTPDIDKFYLGRKKLDLAPDELIAAIFLPKPKGSWYYEKVGGREALAISRLSFAGVIDVRDGVITSLSAAFGAVADTVLRFKELEAMLTGKSLDEARAMKPDFIAAYDRAIVPIRGRVSETWRKEVCLNLLRDFLSQNGI